MAYECCKILWSIKILKFYVTFLLIIDVTVLLDDGFCDVHSVNGDCGSKESNFPYNGNVRKYLLYDVNPGEGFNLRRDVYMRIASLVRQVHKKNSKTSWFLVLPPWGMLYHWKSKDVGVQKQLPWSLFFDIPSLNEYVPVIEFDSFLKENGPEIGEVYYLQHYREFWSDGHWEERFDIQECIEEPSYFISKNGNTYGWFWDYDEVYAKDFHCLSVQGTSSTLKPILQNSKRRSVMIDRAEVILHDSFGGLDYWMARKSMKFAKHLVQIGDEFRMKHLNSSNDKDRTIGYWSSQPKKVGSALGGPYIAVHLRRQDFVKARPADVPDIFHAALQIQKILVHLGLATAFIATDASVSEFEELKHHVPGAVKYEPSKKVKQKLKDGGVAIVEQWICAHARHFFGTYESTFSFRIQEEREILGFHPDTTFNRLCGNNQTTCKQPTRWTIVYS